jgi:RNA polymerase-binding transcription factor DksA
MSSATDRRAAPGPALSAEQYSELRSDLKAELQRLLPGTDQVDERSMQDLPPRKRRRVMVLADALRRLGSDTFGVCVGCRSAIAYERLSVLPETTVCAPCSWSRETLLQA